MANKEHLDLIKQGVEVWNKWRVENADEIPDFSGAYPNDSYLIEARLRRAYLIEAELSGANLTEATLTEVNLNGAILYGAILSGADLCGADLRTSHLTVDQLVEAKSLYKAILLPTTETELREKYPERYKQLIKKPVDYEEPDNETK